MKSVKQQRASAVYTDVTSHFPDCPSLTDLARADLPTALLAHIDNCPRCRMLRAVTHAPESAPATSLDPERFAASVPASADERPTDIDVGTIVRVHADGVEVALVAIVIDLRDDEAVVLPLSVEVDYAADYDVLLDQALLGYRSMVQAWNGGTIEIDQVVDHLAVVDDATLDAIDDVYDAALLGDDSPPNANVGSIIVADEDIRRNFQLHSREFAELFYKLGEVRYSGGDLPSKLQRKAAAVGVTQATLDEWLCPSSPMGEVLPFTRALAGDVAVIDAIDAAAFGDVVVDVGMGDEPGLEGMLLTFVRSPMVDSGKPGTSAHGDGRRKTAAMLRRDKVKNAATKAWVDGVLAQIAKRAHDARERPEAQLSDGEEPS